MHNTQITKFLKHSYIRSRHEMVKNTIQLCYNHPFFLKKKRRNSRRFLCTFYHSIVLSFPGGLDGQKRFARTISSSQKFRRLLVPCLPGLFTSRDDKPSETFPTPSTECPFHTQRLIRLDCHRINVSSHSVCESDLF